MSNTSSGRIQLVDLVEWIRAPNCDDVEALTASMSAKYRTSSESLSAVIAMLAANGVDVPLMTNLISASFETAQSALMAELLNTAVTAQTGQPRVFH